LQNDVDKNAEIFEKTRRHGKNQKKRGDMGKYVKFQKRGDMGK
jgi:hypothetical protein